MGQKLFHRKFHLNVKKNFFTVQVTSHWNRLLREGVESLTGEGMQEPSGCNSYAVCSEVTMIQTWLDNKLSNAI